MSSCSPPAAVGLALGSGPSERGASPEIPKFGLGSGEHYSVRAPPYSLVAWISDCCQPIIVPQVLRLLAAVITVPPLDDEPLRLQHITGF